MKNKNKSMYFCTKEQSSFSSISFKYTYKELISLEETEIIDVKKRDYFYGDENIDRKIIKNILSDIREIYPKVFNKYLNENINIVRDGLQHYPGVHNKLKIVDSYNLYLSILYKINTILAVAVPLNELYVRKDNIKKVYVLGSIIKLDNEFYTVRFIVNSYNNNITKIDIFNLYAINQKKVCSTDLTPHAIPSTISISKFLEIAIKTPLIKNVLSDDVLCFFNLQRETYDKLSENIVYSKTFKDIEDEILIK